MASIRNFIVVGTHRGLIIQVLLAIHTFTKADCFVICPNGIRHLRLSNMCSRIWEAEFDGSDDDKIVDIVNRCAESMSDLVLISADCKGVRMINRVRDRLRVRTPPAPNDAMLDLFDNKWQFYHFCKQHGLQVPPTQLVAAKDKLDFSSAACELGLPFILKPLDQQGSAGLRLISNEQDYRENILDNDTYQFAPLLVQRFIRGVDVGLNLLSIRGKVRAIAMQQRSYPQNEEAKITFFSNNYLEKVAYIICENSRYDGVMNVDARIEEETGNIYLFEANPRFWVSLSASVWCGLNFVAENLGHSQPSTDIRLLTSGKANTFYHPLFRPVLWPYVLFNYGCRGRLSRLMAGDLCTFGSQVRTTFISGLKKVRPPGVPVPGNSGWGESYKKNSAPVP